MPPEEYVLDSAHHGMARETCWISWSGDDEVSVVDYATGEELARVGVGDHPQRIRPGAIREEFLVASGAGADDATTAADGPSDTVATGVLAATGGGAALGGVALLAAVLGLRRRR